MKKDEKKSKFPDLTGDGEVTQADILKGRGVGGEKKKTKKMMGGGMAKKGYAKGGMSKKGYAKGGGVKKMQMGGALGSAPPIMPGSGAMPMESEEERKKRMMRPSPTGMKKGGMAKKGYSKGGATKKGSAKGGKKSKAKVRGAGIARKGVRPVKMR